MNNELLIDLHCEVKIMTLGQRKVWKGELSQYVYTKIYEWICEENLTSAKLCADLANHAVAEIDVPNKSVENMTHIDESINEYARKGIGYIQDLKEDGLLEGVLADLGK